MGVQLTHGEESPFMTVGGLALLGALLASTLTTPALTAQEQPATLGEKLFLEDCAVCHDPADAGAPTMESMRAMPRERVLKAVRPGGVMRAFSAGYSEAEVQKVTDYMLAGARAQVVVDRSAWSCSGEPPSPGVTRWARWGVNASNDRFVADSLHAFRRSNVEGLRLAWAFGLPDAVRARSQPVITETMVLTGSQDGTVFALDRKTGCVWWSFAAKSEVRSSLAVAANDAGEAKTLYFGDFEANVYALNAETGELLWSKSVADHPMATITGSVVHHEGRLYVPMSSTEVLSAYRSDYECCSFRGGVLALRASDGETVWRMYTTAEATQRQRNRNGVQQWGPSGAPVWSTPTIDSARGLVYVGTGENYSSPANDMSDAIIAMSMDNGEVSWVQQTLAGDAWNGACVVAGANCPVEDGPDFDFGAPPILAQVDGKDYILAGQKSGMIYAMDPDDNGKVLWSQRLGMGGFNGGVHWGMTVSGEMLIVPITDTPGNRFTTGEPRPGLHALDIKSGDAVWSTFHPATPGCRGKRECFFAGLSAAATSTEELAFAASLHGVLGVYDLNDGQQVWSFDTRKDFDTVNGVAAHGGTIDSDGAVIAGNQLFINSGYDKFGEFAGNVLLAFEVETPSVESPPGE